MNHTISLLYFYGTFLILCGIVSVIFIGMKAKTALISGGTSGAASIMMAYLISTGVNAARVAGFIIPALLFIVFAWRSTKTFFKVLELIPNQHPDLKGKGIAFLVISLMAVVSIIVVMIQLIVYSPVLNN
ncbi:MAG TPA: hypothetical protein VGK59_07225 [Ohtaekwangia sp.]